MATRNRNQPPIEYRCAFCGKIADDVKIMIAAQPGMGKPGREIGICDQCIYDCIEILEENDLRSAGIRSDSFRSYGS